MLFDLFITHSNPINNIYSYLDNIPNYKKPDIVHSGHYHTTKYQDYEGIEMFRSGAFMHQTPHDKKKNHNTNDSAQQSCCYLYLYLYI